MSQDEYQNSPEDIAAFIQKATAAGMPEAQARVIAENCKLIWQPPTPPGGPG